MTDFERGSDNLPVVPDSTEASTVSPDVSHKGLLADNRALRAANEALVSAGVTPDKKKHHRVRNTVAILAVVLSAGGYGLYRVGSSIIDGIPTFGDVKDKVLTPGETQALPPKTAEVSLSVRREQLSAPLKITGTVEYTVSGRGVLGRGANATCDTPFTGVGHGYIGGDGKNLTVDGEITGDVGNFTLDSDFTYDEPSFAVDLPANGKGPSEYCSEGPLGRAGSVFGDSTNAVPKSEKALAKAVDEIFTEDAMYQLDGDDAQTECSLAGNISSEAKSYNPDLDKVTVTVGERGDFSFDRCVTEGTEGEAEAFRTGRVPNIVVQVDDVFVNA